MDSYLLAIYVTLEQEIAVRQLFINKGWNFKKYEGSDFQDYAEVKEEPSTSSCQGIFAPEGFQHDWTRSEVATNMYGGEDSDIFKHEENKQSNPIFQAQESSSKIRNVEDESVSSGTNDDTSETMDQEVMTKLAEIMEDSLRNMPEHASMKSNADDSKTKGGYCDSDCYLEKGDEELSEGYEKLVDSYGDLTDCLLDDKQMDNASNNGEAVKQRRNQKKKSEEIKISHSKLVRNLKNVKQRIRPSKSLRNKKKFAGVENIMLPLKPQEKKAKDSSKKCGSFHCDDCNYTFKLLGAFKKHKKDGKCVFECEYCGKKFTARYYSNYQVHLKYHQTDRPHACHLCDKSYKDAQSLKIHVRRHAGDRPFVCDVCGKSFYCSSNLIFHKQSIHVRLNKIFKCQMCSAVLSTLGNLRVHLKLVHTSERPFTCEICGKTFKTQKSLEQIHAKVHQEVYPFKCSISGCDKAFKRIDGLNDHIRRHNNQRTHFCDRCGKGFYCNKDLQLHSRTHSGVKPFSCQLCEYKCALAGNMRKHMKTHQ